MRKKMPIRLLIDFGMCIWMFVAMSYQFVSGRNHEIAGAVLLVLFVSHHVLNYRWFTGIAKGKYTASRVFLTVVDIVMLITILILMVSGMRMSEHVFVFLNVPFLSMSNARSLHLVTSYLAFLLLGLHTGVHFGMIQGMVRKALHIKNESLTRTWILRTVGVLIALYGAYALVKRQFLSYITLSVSYAFFDFSESLIAYYTDLLAIAIFMGWIGYYGNMLLRKSSKPTRKEETV